MNIKMFFCLIVFSPFSFADMMYAPTRSLDIDRIVLHYDNLKSNPKTQTNEVKNLYFMTKIVEDLQVLLSFDLPGTQKDSIDKILKGFNKQQLIEIFGDAVFQQKYWVEKISKKKIIKIKTNHKRISDLFGDKTYSGAWFQYQEGKIVLAKKNLMVLFEFEYNKVESLNNAIYGLGGSPLFKLDKIYKTLMWISSDKEKSVLKDRYRKLKMHVSNLPQTHINT